MNQRNKCFIDENLQGAINKYISSQIEEPSKDSNLMVQVMNS